MRNLSTTALLIFAASGAGFVIGERYGRFGAREGSETPSASIIEVHTTIRKSPEFGSKLQSEVTLLGLTMRAESGKEAIYQGGPLFLLVRPTANRDKTITVTAKWAEDADTATPTIIGVPPATIVDGGTAIQQVGALRFSFTAKALPR